MEQIEKIFYDWANDQTDSRELKAMYGKLEDELTKRIGKEKYSKFEDLIMDCILCERLEAFKATKGQDAVQAKITEYEATIAQQQEELQQAKTEAALKVGLLSEGAKATDIDYLIFKLNHDSDWKPELGEDGQIKGFKDKMESLKTQCPNQFETASGDGDDGYKRMDDGKLPDSDDLKDSVTKEEFAKMGYKSRVELRENNPDLYEKLTK